MKASLTLALAAASLLGASGCIVEHERIPDRAPVPAPPPPPADEADVAQPPADAEASAEAPAPGTEVDEDVFYARLSPYGHWRWTPDYGRVWVPTVAYGWRPYTYGHWVLTDWGWTFVSDDPWGWAAYHYGSWAYGPAFGWYWVPGRIWAPAWVTWRWGFGFACWAPIGPAGFVYGWRSPAWVVVPQQHFTHPIIGHVVSPHAVGPIVSQAPPLAGPHAAPAPGGHFGPPVAQVQAAVGHPVAAVPARTVIGRPASTPVSGRGGGIAQPGAPRTNPGVGRPGPGMQGGPLRSPTPQPPPQSRSRYGVSNTGRPYFPGERGYGSPRTEARPGTGQVPGGAGSRGWSGGRPWSGGARGSAGGGGQGWGGASAPRAGGNGGGSSAPRSGGGGYAPHAGGGGGGSSAPHAGGGSYAPHAGGGGSAPAPSGGGGGGGGHHGHGK